MPLCLNTTTDCECCDHSGAFFQYLMIKAQTTPLANHTILAAWSSKFVYIYFLKEGSVGYYGITKV